MDPHFKACNYHATSFCYFRPYIYWLRYALEYMDWDLPTFLKSTVSANTTKDIFYKYSGNSDSFCLLVGFFFLIGKNPLPRAKKGPVILKQQFSLYKRAEMHRKVMLGR